MDILGQAAMNGITFGGTGSLFERSRSDQTADRAQAIRSGRAVADMDGGNIDGKLREVAADFVSVFMNQIVKSMRVNVGENPTMHGGNGEKFFQEMLDSEHSKTLAAGSGYGLTDLVYQSLAAKVRVAEATPESERSAEPAIDVGE
ncbi:MAG: rod-binding protein [Planctomycetota bacterium]|jgi:Rod binding domain-containing protein|nr:rod-binding protein [Planctomycetota bacterium]